MWQPGDKMNQKFDLVACTQYIEPTSTNHSDSGQSIQPQQIYPSQPNLQGNEKNVLLIKSFVCPLGGKIMTEPVILIDSGITYEKDNICNYMKDHDRDPLTGGHLATKTYLANVTLQIAVAEYIV